ncbi:MAG: hypothetical protein J1E78_08065 [Muribaculaceae bacterium]|nr:hypothetical protein [Muribaculaceae bacterium]
MPSGYTEKIYKGDKVTLKDYLLLCARQFGACIMMRDEPMSTPIPERFEPDDYHLKEIERIEKELKELNDNPKTQEEWAKEYQNAYEKAINKYKEREYQKARLKLRYENMIIAVSNWEPPTKDHINLKEFALTQLKESLDFNTYSCPFEFPEKEEWIATQSSGSLLRDSLAYHKERYAKEIEACKGRTQWIKDLRDSLENNQIITDEEVENLMKD